MHLSSKRTSALPRRDSIPNLVAALIFFFVAAGCSTSRPGECTSECAGGSTCINGECELICGESRECEDGYECKASLCRKVTGECDDGYKRSASGSCVDIDECSSSSGVCDPLTQCQNSPGSYACGSCPSGYLGDGATGCLDIDECGLGTCNSGTSCTNTAGSFVCGDCPPGHTGDGLTSCVNVNECLFDNGGCQKGSLCQDTAGSRTCACENEGIVGETCFTFLSSCNQILQLGLGTGTGLYLLDPDGPGHRTDPPFYVYCDMDPNTEHGGGWTLLFHNDAGRFTKASGFYDGTLRSDNTFTYQDVELNSRDMELASKWIPFTTIRFLDYEYKSADPSQSFASKWQNETQWFPARFDRECKYKWGWNLRSSGRFTASRAILGCHYGNGAGEPSYAGIGARSDDGPDVKYNCFGGCGITYVLGRAYHRGAKAADPGEVWVR